MRRFSCWGIGLAAALAASSSMPVHAQAAAASVKDAASLEALGRMGT